MKLKNLNKEQAIEERLLKTARKEHDLEFDTLRQRHDYSGEFDYFLDILSLTLRPAEFRRRFNRPLVGLACIQVPLELFDAFGFHPFRMCCSSSASHRLSSPILPSLACPVIKSLVSSFFLNGSLEKFSDLIIIPTTCDWTAKLPEMIGDRHNGIHVMELPRLRESERNRGRWLEEVHELKRVLEVRSGGKLDRRRLQGSIEKYQKAWQVLGRLIEAKRLRRIPGTWSLVMANAFMLDNVSSWTEHAGMVLKEYKMPQPDERPGVFLAGSPVFFPHLKISQLIEEAGMGIVADELCTSERILVGAPVYDDPSQYGLLKALAERYQLACSCPAFADNDRRIRNIIATMRKHNIKGLVYHLLKGCHPYDIESFRLEKAIKEQGLHFIKIETDYSKEDSKNILVRLEAFSEMLMG